MISSSELRRIEAFADLPEDQVDWFLGQSEHICLKAGEAFVRQGDPPHWMFVFLEGLFQGEASSAATPFPCRPKPLMSVGSSLSQNEVLYRDRTSSHRWPSSEISCRASPRTCTENAGADDQVGCHDVRQNPRRNSNRTAARPFSLIGQTGCWARSRVEQSRVRCKARGRSTARFCGLIIAQSWVR